MVLLVSTTDVGNAAELRGDAGIINQIPGYKENPRHQGSAKSCPHMKKCRPEEVSRGIAEKIDDIEVTGQASKPRPDEQDVRWVVGR